MGTVQITSGEYKRKIIKTPGEGTHPMGERERLALFNTILTYLPEATLIDAYAGSGALGIEALSRGAKHVVFIDKSPTAIQTIKENCASVGIEKNKLDFFQGPVEAFCKKKTSTNELIASPKATPSLQVDIILADPPYDKFKTEEVNLLTTLLTKNGIFALSHPNEAPELKQLELLKTKKYAAAHLSIYKKSSNS